MKATLRPGIESELRYQVPAWARIRAINPHLDWPEEQSVGVHIDASHCEVEAHDGVELISKGTHQRYVVDRRRFSEKTGGKVRT